VTSSLYFKRILLHLSCIESSLSLLQLSESLADELMLEHLFSECPLRFLNLTSYLTAWLLHRSSLRFPELSQNWHDFISCLSAVICKTFQLAMNHAPIGWLEHSIHVNNIPLLKFPRAKYHRTLHGYSLSILYDKTFHPRVTHPSLSSGIGT
jgi:hypothetical protein